MGYSFHLYINKSHPKTVDYLEQWKKQGVNMSDKICQLIDTAAKKEGMEILVNAK
jgi:ribosomal protein S16